MAAVGFVPSGQVSPAHLLAPAVDEMYAENSGNRNNRMDGPSPEKTSCGKKIARACIYCAARRNFSSCCELRLFRFPSVFFFPDVLAIVGELSLRLCLFQLLMLLCCACVMISCCVGTNTCSKRKLLSRRKTYESENK